MKLSHPNIIRVQYLFYILHIFHYRIIKISLIKIIDYGNHI